MNYNRVILAGNLTRDPELSHLPNHTAVVELGMAVNRKWRSQSGEMKEEATFVDVRAYGKQAETINQYMTRGKPILIEGRLKYDSWEGKDGKKKSKLYVIVDSFQFVGKADGGGGERREPAPAPQSHRYAGDGSDDAATVPDDGSIPF